MHTAGAKMIIGAHFEMPTINKTILKRVLVGMSVEQYYWYYDGSQSEVWNSFDAHEASDLFTSNCYDGESFKELIRQEHYVIFLKLLAFTTEGDYSCIQTNKEFKSSNCQLLLLICDSTFVDVYAKDEVLVHTIYNNALIKGYRNVQYLTEDNDSRTGMDLL